MIQNFAYIRVKTLDGAVEQMKTAGARVHAGGTDLLGCLREGILSVDKVVSISRLSGLRGISETVDGGLRIGALTTIAEVAAHPLVRERYPGLAQAAASVASPQLRNQGTLGGNLCQKSRCWYYRGEFDCLRKGGDTCFALDGENQTHCIFGGDGCYMVHPSDTAPMLAALGAELNLADARDSGRRPVAEFHVSPSDDPARETVLAHGQIVTEVFLPSRPAGMRTSYRKVRARGSWDFALAGVALAIQFDGAQVRGARVYLSGVAPVPWRSRATEEAITGRELTTAVVSAAAEAAVAGAEPLAKNGYKVPLLRGVMEEELTRLAEG